MATDPAVLKAFFRDCGVTPKQNSVSYIFDCPKCGKDQRLYIRKRDGMFRCWFCWTTEGYGGKPEYALADIFSMPLAKVRARLYLGEEMPEGVELNTKLRDWYDPDEEVDEEAEPLRTLQWPLDYYPLDHKHGAKGARYLLEERGVPLEIAMQYGIRYAPVKQRVVFPVQLAGQLYGWQERLTVPNMIWSNSDGVWREIIKILSSKEIPREHVLMFGDRLKGSKHAVLLEGPVDALKAHLCGGNVCAMGKGVGQRQLGLIRNAGIRRIYLALDPDAGDETERLASMLWDLEVYLMDPSPHKDFGEATMEETLDVFHRAPRINANRCFSLCK